MPEGQRFAATAPRRTTTVGMLGLAVSSAAWIVSGELGQELARRHGLHAAWSLLLVVLAVAAGSLGLIWTGALTDRYGARRVLAVVSTIVGTSVLLTGFGTAVTAVFAACLAMAAAGTTFAIVGSLVIRAGRPYRRGLGLSVVAAGTAGAALAAVVVRPMIRAFPLPWTAVLTAAVVFAYAGLAVLVGHDAPIGARHAPRAPDVATVLRIPAARQWCVVAAATAGPIAAALFYLPAYAVHRPWGDATVITAAVIAIAALAQPVGGRLAEVGRAVPVLVGCCRVAGALGLVIVVEPHPAVVVGCLLLAAAAVGTAGGVLLCRIGGAVPPERAGLIIGMAGCAGGLGGLLAPALLSAGHSLHGQYGVGVMALSGLAFAAATYARRRGWVTPLTSPVLHTAPVTLERPEFRTNGTTVVAVAADDTVAARTGVLGILAELATRQELVIVYAPDVRSAGTLTAAQLVAALRDRLPRHQIAAVLVSSGEPPDLTAWALLQDLTDDGALPVAVVEGRDLRDITRTAARHLRANAFRLLTSDPALGVHLEPLLREPLDAPVAQPRRSPP